GALDRVSVVGFPGRRLWPQADDDVVLSDVPDPDADHLPVGARYPGAVVRLRSVWIFHPRRFFVDAHMAAGTLSNANARDCGRFHLRCTAIDLPQCPADRRHLSRPSRPPLQNGPHYTDVLHCLAHPRTVTVLISTQTPSAN